MQLRQMSMWKVTAFIVTCGLVDLALLEGAFFLPHHAVYPLGHPFLLVALGGPGLILGPAFAILFNSKFGWSAFFQGAGSVPRRPPPRLRCGSPYDSARAFARTAWESLAVSCLWV